MKPLDIIALLNVPGVGKKTVGQILDKHQHLSVASWMELFSLLEEEASGSSRIKLPEKQVFEHIYNKAELLLEKTYDLGITPIDSKHSDYPARYRNMPDAPILLYAKGNKTALNSDYAVAIIGTREATEFGMKAGAKLASIFAQQDFVIVSGLAIGCDTVAHEGCLAVNGITVAVMAGSIEKVYPKENRALADEIIDKNGCLLSEYPVDATPQRTYFVERDRLQSGLSQAVIVIETDVKGGTMHTVGFSKKQNRLLACLGGHPEKYYNHPKIQGNKKLLKEDHAVLLSNPAEIEAFIQVLAPQRHADQNTMIGRNTNIEQFIPEEGIVMEPQVQYVHSEKTLEVLPPDDQLTMATEPVVAMKKPDDKKPKKRAPKSQKDKTEQKKPKAAAKMRTSKKTTPAKRSAPKKTKAASRENQLKMPFENERNL